MVLAGPDACTALSSRGGPADHRPCRVDLGHVGLRADRDYQRTARGVDQAAGVRPGLRPFRCLVPTRQEPVGGIPNRSTRESLPAPWIQNSMTSSDSRERTTKGDGGSGSASGCLLSGQSSGIPLAGISGPSGKPHPAHFRRAGKPVFQSGEMSPSAAEGAHWKRQALLWEGRPLENNPADGKGALALRQKSHDQTGSGCSLLRESSVDPPLGSFWHP